MKRILNFLFISAMAFSLILSCGKDEPNEKRNNPIDEDECVPAPDPDEALEFVDLGLPAAPGPGPSRTESMATK